MCSLEFFVCMHTIIIQLQTRAGVTIMLYFEKIKLFQPGSLRYKHYHIANTSHDKIFVKNLNQTYSYKIEVSVAPMYNIAYFICYYKGIYIYMHICMAHSLQNI